MEEKLFEYAKLVMEVGLNVQKGQTVIISSPVECAHFARLCADAAYNCGCREVVMNWSDDHLTRQKYLRADSAVFERGAGVAGRNISPTMPSWARPIWPLPPRTRRR